MPYAIKEMQDIQQFIEDQNYSRSTARSYRYYIKRFDRYLRSQGVKSDAEVQPEDLRDFIQSNDWAPNTQTVVYNALVGYFRWKYGESHPALKWKPRRGDTVRLLRYLNADELRFILGWLRGQGTDAAVRDEAMIALMADTGLRVSEVCRLQLSTVDLVRRKLTVQIKGGRAGEAVYSENTQNRLQSWLDVRARVIRRCANRYAERGVDYLRPVEVFISTGGNTPGRKMTREGVKKNFLLIGQRSGFGKFAPHDLRRTFAMVATRNGAPTRVVQAAGRWRSIDMVERYTRFIEPEDLEEYFPMRDIE